MIQRDIEAKALYFSRKYAVVTITGPRQSGKTTLVEKLLSVKQRIKRFGNLNRRTKPGINLSGEPKPKGHLIGLSWPEAPSAKIIALFLLSFLVHTYGFGQSSMKEILLLQKKLEQSKVTDKAAVLLDLAYEYSIIDSVTQSLIQYKKAFTIAEVQNQPEHMTSACYQLGELYYGLDDYVNAQKYYMKGYQIAEKNRIYRLMVYCSAGLGSVFIFNNEFESALKYIKRAMLLAEKYNYSEDIPKLINLMGVVYLYKNQLDSAMYYYQKLLEAGIEQKDSTLIGCAYNNMADVNNANGNYREAIALLEKSYSISIVKKQMKAVASILSNKGESLMKLGNYEEAKKTLFESLAIAKKQGFLSTEMKVYENLSQLYKDQGDYQQAFDYFQQYTNCKDSIFDLKKQRQIHHIEAQNQIDQAEKQYEIYRQKAYIRSIFLGFSLIFTVLVLIISILYYHKFKLKIAVQELEKTRIKGALDMKNREMVSLSMNLTQKQQLVSQVKESVRKANNLPGDSAAEDLLREISGKINTDHYIENNWVSFFKHFNDVHPTFFSGLQEKHPDLSANDLRHCAYIKLNLRSNEVALINNINKKSVYMIRYRLKSKLGLNPTDTMKRYLGQFG